MAKWNSFHHGVKILDDFRIYVIIKTVHGINIGHSLPDTWLTGADASDSPQKLMEIILAKTFVPLLSG